MTNHRCGRQSFTFACPPVITGWASVVGKKESLGPLANTFDIKHTDRQMHKMLTGAEPDIIWHNLAAIDALGAKTRLRCLMVNGLTTDDGHLARVAQLYRTLSHVSGVQLLRYHPMGGSKAAALGLADSGRPDWIPTEQQMQRARQILLQENVPVLTE